MSLPFFMKPVSISFIVIIFFLHLSACKKCYTCSKDNRPDIEICGKGFIGKAAVEVDRSNLVAEGYYCR